MNWWNLCCKQLLHDIPHTHNSTPPKRCEIRACPVTIGDIFVLPPPLHLSLETHHCIIHLHTHTHGCRPYITSTWIDWWLWHYLPLNDSQNWFVGTHFDWNLHKPRISGRAQSYTIRFTVNIVCVSVHTTQCVLYSNVCMFARMLSPHIVSSAETRTWPRFWCRQERRTKVLM